MTDTPRRPQRLRSLTLLSGSLPVHVSLVGEIGKPLTGYDNGSNDPTFEESFQASTKWVGGPPSIIGTKTTVEGSGVPITILHKEARKQ